MAAPKKPEHKPASDAGLWVIGGAVLLAMVVFGFTSLFNPQYINLEYFFSKLADGVGPVLSALFDSRTWHVVGVVSSILSIFFMGIIIFSLVRMREIQNHEKEEIDHEISIALARDAEQASKENPRWRYILGLIDSPNESDWRMAILESDSMLEEVLEEKGYSGDTLGEKLIAARDNSFASLDNAWEAHDIRNKIAHVGSDFPITQLEARRTIRLFETVFEEFNAI